MRSVGAGAGRHVPQRMWEASPAPHPLADPSHPGWEEDENHDE